MREESVIVHSWDRFKSSIARSNYKLFIFVALLLALPLSVFIAMQPQEIRQRASENTASLNNLFELEQKVSGIDASGHLNQEASARLKEFDPKTYAQFQKKGLVTSTKD